MAVPNAFYLERQKLLDRFCSCVSVVTVVMGCPPTIIEDLTRAHTSSLYDVQLTLDDLQLQVPSL